MRESQKKEDTVARNLRKVANRFVFPMIHGSGGSKSMSLKRGGAGPCHVVTGEMKNCASLWRKAHFQVKMYKTRQRRTRKFWKLRCQQLCAAVARSTSAGQNVQSTPSPDRFLKLGCGKMARRCGAKHICKAKCKKMKVAGHFWTF